MRVKTLIAGKPDFKKEKPEEDFIDVAEFFCDTIQGEGINIGAPATFFRVQHCTQNCVWCDTRETWRYGNPYTFNELFQLMDEHGVPEKLRYGQHLVLTGGSPMRQQNRLLGFLEAFEKRYAFKPYTEIENECTLRPLDTFAEKIDCWNNSPKLSNSLNPKSLRYQPELLKLLASYPNSWFKFVVSDEQDWQEIETEFLDTEILNKNQIILMPLGGTREELHNNRETVVDMAIRENVRYTSREHIELWDIATGV